MTSSLNIPRTSTEVSVSQSYSCTLCAISFESSTLQRAHMKGAWHVYNLKRRIASLPPLSFSVFTEQVTTVEPVDVYECSTCQKVYDTSKAYQNHLKSRYHLQKVSPLDVEEEIASVDHDDGVQHLAMVASQMENLNFPESDGSGSESESDVEIENGGDLSMDEEESEEDHFSDFDEGACLFCGHASASLEENVTHMQKAHGLFIPNIDTLTSPYSFFAYLHTLITEFHECLGCGRALASSEAAKDHMKDKGHCRINVDGEEWKEFWEVADGAEGTERAKGKLLAAGEKFSLLGGNGRSLRHRRHRHQSHRVKTRGEITASTQVTTETGTGAETPGQEEKSLTVGSRREMGIIGLSDLQKKSLRVVEKKMLKAEMRARNESRAVLERRGNQQRHFKNDVPGPKLG